MPTNFLINVEIPEDFESADVRQFHHKFNQIVSVGPTHLTRRKMAERANFLLEELNEFAGAAGLRVVYNVDSNNLKFEVDEDNHDQNMELMADALIDLTYVAKGTAVMMGLPWKKLWDDVQRANMAKELGETPRSRANPGQFLMDVTKPKGWVPPHTERILALAGYERESFINDEGEVQDNLCRDDEVYKK
jgi:predicted HAD superfamily Cof-like phosphohydrolase